MAVNFTAKLDWLEKAIIVKKFFESFGEVTGIIMKKQMLVISFKKAIAARLTGRLLQVKFSTGGKMQEGS